MSELQEQIRQYGSYLYEWNASYEEYARRVGLSYTSLAVLSTLYDAENCTQKMLCERCFLPKQTVNAAITAFYKKGWKNSRRTAGTRPSTLRRRGRQQWTRLCGVSGKVSASPWGR